MGELTFDAYQKLAKTTDIALGGLFKKYPDLPPEIQDLLEISYAGLGLGESGEVQNNIKKMIRDDQCVSEDKKNALKKEIGDIFWYIAKICNDCGWSMGEVAQANVDKLASRKERGVIHGSVDNG